MTGDSGNCTADSRIRVSVTVEAGGRIFVRPAEYLTRERFGEYLLAAKSTEGYQYAKAAKAWTWPPSSFAARGVVDAFNAINRDDAFKRILADHDAYEEAQSCKDLSRCYDQPPSAKTESWREQCAAFWFGADLPAVYYAMGMGCGKSKTALDVINYATGRDGERTRILIVAPSRVVKWGTWPGEFDKHSSKPYKIYSAIKGSTAVRGDKIREAINDDFVRVAVVISYEILRYEPIKAALKSVIWDAIVYDEAHKLKSPTGIQSKTAAKLADYSRKRIALSGTPNGQDKSEIYGQARALDPAIFGKSWTAFKAKWFDLDFFNRPRILKSEHKDEFLNRMGSFMFVSSSDSLNLPPSVDTYETGELEPSAMKIYKQVQEDLLAELDEGTLVVQNVLHRTLRLRQCVNGFLPNPAEPGKMVRVSTAKADLLADVLDSIADDEPVVIFAEFHSDFESIEAVCVKRGIAYGEISGRVKDDSAPRRWRDGSIRVLGAQIRAASMGIDLTRARYAIYYSGVYSVTDYYQSRRRVLRPGQKKNVTYVHLQMGGTIDEIIYKTLHAKNEMNQAVLEAIRGVRDTGGRRSVPRSGVSSVFGGRHDK